MAKITLITGSTEGSRRLGYCILKRSRSHYQKRTQYQGGSLHNFTDFKSYLVRKNSIGSTVYQYGLER